MRALLPQIRYWIRTGFVAKNKIVSLYIPQIYAILRGKVGKPIEFGLNWASSGFAADSCAPPWPRTSSS